MSEQAEKLIGGRYRELKKIGAGGMSIVVMAEDTVLKRTVALKLLAEHLASDPDFVTRFRHEALSVARLQHQNIVQVFDSGLDGASDRHYIVMEYVDGTPLSGLIAGGKTLEPARAVEIAGDALEALECAHRAGIVHRDVKPANLIVTHGGHTKLADFGIAKAAEQTRVTQVGSVLGTVAYLSPEQATGGETGPRSDVYALAVCLYETLSGRLPYEYKSITELAMKQRDETPQPITNFHPEVPVELDRAVRVALSFDPNLRFATAREFAQAIRNGLDRQESEFVTQVLSDPAAITRKLGGGPPRTPTRGRRGAEPVPQRASTTPPHGDPTAVTQIARPRPGQRKTYPVPPAATTASGKRSGGRNAATRVLAVLLLAGAIGAAVVFGTSAAQLSPEPVIEQNVQDQIDGLRDFVQDHS